MKYSKMVKKACIISFEAHKEDIDKGGYPYVYYPFYLASQFDDEDIICVALLHDVIEDHNDKYSFEYLKEEGFNDKVIDALRLLTHNKNVEYMDYIDKISKNEIARKVKIVDLKHNMDVSRNDGNIPPKFEIYKKACEYLLEIDNCK